MSLATKNTISLAPEWAAQRAVWMAWPADAAEWNGDLDTPRREVAALVRALSETSRVRLLVNGAEAEISARAALGDAAEIVPGAYGDIWLRDTGPIFAHGERGALALRFKNNGWGGKFDLVGDDTVGDDIARHAGIEMRHFDYVLEGGAIDHDGQGTVLTTRPTLLNANRNGWTKEQAEDTLTDALGARKIIWIDDGLANDHTDGHVDNIARFVGPGRVVCQSPAGADDPNAEVLDAIARRLACETDALGGRLEVLRIPGPGRVLNDHGEIAPASHMNFVIANGLVVVPVYRTATAMAAIDALRDVFPGRKVIGLPSHGLLGAGDDGGGSFHCITLQEPA